MWYSVKPTDWVGSSAPQTYKFESFIWFWMVILLWYTFIDNHWTCSFWDLHYFIRNLINHDEPYVKQMVTSTAWFWNATSIRVHTQVMLAVQYVRMLIEFVVVTSWNCKWKQLVSVESMFDLVLCTSRKQHFLVCGRCQSFICVRDIYI
jgi:hypothetical protein